MLKKSKLLIILVLVLTSCSPSKYSNEGMVTIPVQWHSPIDQGVIEKDCHCSLWWDAFDDPLLTCFLRDGARRNPDVLLAALDSNITFLKTLNDIRAEVAKNYVEFRGLQMRLKTLNESIKTAGEILILNKDLANRGFFNSSQENEDQKNYESFLMQQSLAYFSMEKIILQLSTLLNYPVETVAEMLEESQDLPPFKDNISVGSPKDLICHNLSIEEARKHYKACPSKQSLYTYQKVVLENLKEAEIALATLNYQREHLKFLENAKNLRFNSYQLIKDLHSKGLESDPTLLQAYLQFLADENAVIQGKVDLWMSYINLYHIF